MDDATNIQLDYVLIEKMAIFQARDEIIAGRLGIDPSVFKKLKAQDEKLAAILTLGRAKGKANVLARQYEQAINGERTALIWWGKQHLGQSDKQTVEQHSSLVLFTSDQVQTMRRLGMREPQKVEAKVIDPEPEALPEPSESQADGN